MSGNLSVYSFTKVNLLVGGVPMVDFMDGDDAIKFTPGDDFINPIVGADGKPIISISTDESAILEMKLKPTSASITALQALVRRSRISLRPLPFPVVLTDFTTSNVITGTNCMIMAPPEVSYGKNATPRIWRVFIGCYTEATIGQL